MPDKPEFEALSGRRDFFHASLAALILPLGTVPGASAAPVEAVAKKLFQHDLPKVNLDGWDFVAADITYPGGAFTPPHLHPGFVIGYVLEGEFRTRTEGQAEAIYKAGEMFFEPLASHHMVSRGASETQSCRILVVIFGEKGKQKTIEL